MSEAHKGMTFSEEHRRKIAEAHKGENNPFFGKHFSEEHRQKIAEALKDKHPSAETRRKLSEAHKGNHNVKGKHWWNNGISNKRSRECPGEGWKRGMFKKEEAK